MLGSSNLNTVGISSRLNLVADRCTSQKTTSNRRKSGRKIQTIEKNINIRKQITKEELGKVIKATVIDYSSRGCGLLIETEQSPKLQDTYELTSVRLDSRSTAIKAKVAWWKKLTNNTYRIGLQYIGLI